jgi:LmbE family N-acetylglucosaminyl deacetylase
LTYCIVQYQILPMTVFDEGRRLLVVVAHPDDETFGCGSLLLRAADAGVVTAVCCATRGDAGEWPEDLALPPGGIAEQRERELYAAAEVLGVSRVDVLGFCDSGMEGDAGLATLAGADIDVVADRVRRVVDDFGPDVILTLDASDGHRDHARVRDVTVAVAQQVGVPVYLYCLARRLMARWAEIMTERDPGSSYLHLGELGTPDEDIDLVLDTTAWYERREQAIAVHQSQISPFEDLPQDLRREWLTTEHLAGPIVETRTEV